MALGVTRSDELINIPVCVPTIIPKHDYSNRYPGLFQLFLAVSKKLLSEERFVNLPIIVRTEGMVFPKKRIALNTGECSPFRWEKEDTTSRGTAHVTN
jgi:hypothetical protein